VDLAFCRDVAAIISGGSDQGIFGQKKDLNSGIAHYGNVSSGFARLRGNNP